MVFLGYTGSATLPLHTSIFVLHQGTLAAEKRQRAIGLRAIGVEAVRETSPRTSISKEGMRDAGKL